MVQYIDGARTFEAIPRVEEQSNTNNVLPDVRMRRANQKISNDVRRLVAQSIVDESMSVSEVARRFKISRSAASKIATVYRIEGRPDKKKQGGTKHKKMTSEMQERLLSLLDDDCTTPLNLLANKLNEEFAVTISRKTVERALSAFHYTLKMISLVPEKRNDDNTIERRYEFVTHIVGLEPRVLLFVDEVGFQYTMRLSRGRSLSGTRANCHVPTIRSKNNSVAAAMSMTGLQYFRVQERPYNKELFGSFIDELFLDLQEKGLHGMTIVMDNVPFHRADIIRQKFENSGHSLLYLPPYSPFLNPIENLFSKWKHIVRVSAPKTPESLTEDIYSAANHITPDDCLNFLGHLRSYFGPSIRREPIMN